MSVQDQDQSPARRICLGTIATAHGVRGLVKILFHGDDPSLLDGTAYTSGNEERYAHHHHEKLNGQILAGRDRRCKRPRRGA
ncbi:MAG: hypothetical protein H6867_09640 [Rhodospirillales bacterium]|nr:hypothetical protein [Rhodospirillales bacterium]